jgi:pimeloyl-ACP methyl ester carboxylesterase
MSTQSARPATKEPTSSPGPAPVLFLPGIILPATLRYAALIDALGDAARAITKELEVYAGEAPPDGYSIEYEIEGISRAADEAGFEHFHLYGHSGGGACALAYAATHPERLLSLALDEPASDFSPEAKEELRQEMERIHQLSPEEQIGAFVSMQLAPGVEPPPRPSGPAPEWMAKRPAGIDALTSAIQRFKLPPADRLRQFTQPFYYSYGSLSSQSWERMKLRLEALFPNFRAERYEGLHHFNTSHVAEPHRVAAALQQLWLRAAQGTGEKTPA